MFKIKQTKSGFSIKVDKDEPKSLKVKFNKVLDKLSSKYGKTAAHNIAAGFAFSSCMREDFNDHFYLYWDLDVRNEHFKDFIYDLKNH